MVSKVAVIGLGNISTRHRKNIKYLYPAAEIYAVAASGKLPKSQVYNIDYIYTSINSLPIKELDMAIIASPATFHADYACQFIEAGVPTLIEKPLSASNEDADRILDTYLKYKTPVAIGYCLRYLSSTKKIKKILDSNLIGNIYNVFAEVGQYLPNWRPDKDYRQTVSASKYLGGGALLELSHELDYIYWLFGDIKPISAVIRSSPELSLEVEDCVDIFAEINDALVTIHLDFLQKQAYRKCRIIGSKAVLEWDLINNNITIINSEGTRVLFDGASEDRNCMYLDMITDFEIKIKNNKNKCVSLVEGIKTVKLINKIKSMADYK